MESHRANLAEPVLTDLGRNAGLHAIKTTGPPAAAPESGGPSPRAQVVPAEFLDELGVEADDVRSVGSDDINVHCIGGAVDALVIRDAAVAVHKVRRPGGDEPERLMGSEHRSAAVTWVAAEAGLPQVVDHSAGQATVARSDPETDHDAADRMASSRAGLADPGALSAVLGAGNGIPLVPSGVRARRDINPALRQLPPAGVIDVQDRFIAAGTEEVVMDSSDRMDGPAGKVCSPGAGSILGRAVAGGKQVEIPGNAATRDESARALAGCGVALAVEPAARTLPGRSWRQMPLWP